MPAAENILRNNPLIDRLYLWTDEHRMILRNIKFDILMNADKSQYACAFANEVNAKTKLGFLLNEDGVIVPANESAMYSYILGNNDQLKFRENTRTGIDILHEVFELANKGDDYIFTFSKAESDFIGHYKEKIGYDTKKIYVGFNTGCSELFPNKKMTIDQHIWLIKNMLPDARLMIVLLGGREDTDRNNMIYHAFTKEERARIINTPTDQGIRKGACYMAIPDIVITGDSFGLHLAIALRRWIIVWFGLSCAAEIELYGRGEKLMPKDLECSPCWKRECPNNLECIQQIDLDRILELVKNYKKQ
jgi:heptosyltransferase-2